ncbi:MAG: hypothetical protein R3B98_03070 [Hyphomonas sp.]
MIAEDVPGLLPAVEDCGAKLAVDIDPVTKPAALMPRLENVLRMARSRSSGVSLSEKERPKSSIVIAMRLAGPPWWEHAASPAAATPTPSSWRRLIIDILSLPSRNGPIL